MDIDADIDKPIIEVADNVSPWTVFLEVASPEVMGPLPSFDKDQDVMLFFKFYDAAKEKVYYMGHMYVGITTKMSAVVPELVKRANLPAGTALSIYEEIKPNMLEKVDDLDKPLEHVLEELMDGDILVFQKEIVDGNYRYNCFELKKSIMAAHWTKMQNKINFFRTFFQILKCRRFFMF